MDIISNYIVVKNCNVCLKKTENKQKEAGNGPFKKISDMKI